ncbi:MAG: hypothetical protein U9O06_06570 [Euryarchaeota archaeon]|nr:hypothetical protein [Euryarchaeota archaeon]
MSGASRETSKQLGDRAETEVIAYVDELEYVADQEAEHFDAVPSRARYPSEQVRFAGIAVIEQDRPVEIKTCIPRLSSGQRGRFYLRRGQHDRLVEAGGCYLFAVTTPHQREPIACKVAAARTVTDVIPSWRDAGDGRQQCSQLSLSRIFDPNEIGGSGQ